jgi:hypothetical protein
MNSAWDWKTYYAREREHLGPAGLHACLDRAAALGEMPVSAQRALVFPHTRLKTSGELAAAAALAVLRSGRDEVLALGVLHGARREDAGLVQRARAGDPGAVARLRGVHGPGVPEDAGYWQEEFSLDNFCALLEAAAARTGQKPPRVICRFPFLVGEAPADLPGLKELEHWLALGAALVATADPIHHGVGYGTPAAECLSATEPRTIELARETVARSFGLLASRDYAGFLRDAAAVRSDFRDPGPVLAQLLTGTALEMTVHHLKIVDYSDALCVASPTWVAGALASFSTEL